MFQLEHLCIHTCTYHCICIIDSKWVESWELRRPPKLRPKMVHPGRRLKPLPGPSPVYKGGLCDLILASTLTLNFAIVMHSTLFLSVRRNYVKRNPVKKTT